MAPSDTRFFTDSWVITLPSHPHLRFERLTAANLDESIAVRAAPINNTSITYPGEDIVWNEERIAGEKERMLKRFETAKTEYTSLEVLVLIDGQIVGQGGIHPVPHVADMSNVGIQLLESARGKGVGKALMTLLLRLTNELPVGNVHAGTMKANTAMRALGKSLGLKETEEVFEVPGVGVVAEIVYNDIVKTEWRDLEMKVEFTGPM